MGGAFLSQPIKTKNTCKYQHSKIRVVTSEMQGWRKHMEDAILFHRISKETFLFGVFDGHGGMEVSKFSANHLPEVLQATSSFAQGNYQDALIESFRKIDEMLGSEEGEKELRAISKQNGMQTFEDSKIADNVGCTANVLLMVDNAVYVANAGDSRSALSRQGRYIALSKDHKPDDEEELSRINAAGSKVEQGRINGHLNLSRCLGDQYYKKTQKLSYDKQAVTCKPDVKKMELCKDDDFIIMGCDGIWERYEEKGQDLVDLVRNERMKGLQPEEVLESMMDKFLGSNPKTESLGCDNMSVVLIEFNKKAL